MDPAAYDTILDQAAKDIEKKIDDLLKDFH